MTRDEADDDSPADDMLDGLVCEICGEFMADVIEGAAAPGHPRRCPRCQR